MKCVQNHWPVSYTHLNKICLPIQELVLHVHEIEEGNLDETINVSGSKEICQLGFAISQMKYVIKNLMKDIVMEYEQKRKTELDALQSCLLYTSINSAPMQHGGSDKPLLVELLIQEERFVFRYTWWKRSIRHCA